MSKIAKKIKKYIGNDTGILVIGNAFGQLEGLSGIFKTIFVVSQSDEKIRCRNIIYRENFDNINDIGDVPAVLVDLDSLDKLEMMPTYWTRFKPLIFIEGDQPIDRTKSSYLYHYGYRCVEKLGFSHVWKRI